MNALDRAVLLYRDIRTEYDALKKSQTEERKVYQKKMAELEQRFAQALSHMGADSVRCEHGTVYKSERVSTKVTDWDATLGFIRDTDNWDLLDHRVSKAVVEEILEETGEIVPGVERSSEILIGVRKPT